MKRLDEVVESLHPLERKILRFLKNNIGASEIASNAEMKPVDAMRALQWLEDKGAVSLNLEVKETAMLGSNGEFYSQSGLPERRFLKALMNHGSLTLGEVQDIACLNKDETSISLGLLKRGGMIELGREITITDKGKKQLYTPSKGEKLLKSLPRETKLFSSEERKIFGELLKRKDVVKIEQQKIYTVNLKDLGEQLMKVKLDENVVDTLTPEMLKRGTWENKKFRRYDVRISAGDAYGAKRHIVSQAANYIRKVWMDMGFKEMSGPILESSFWNFDALFTPQDHPARDMQDTFFLQGSSKLPDKKLVASVKKVHEEKWKSEWSEKIAKESVLRTHTTPLSAKTLADLKESDLPAKFFSVSKVFRNEALDWSHLFELTQVEGIVVDPNANFQDLIGYLKQFYKKLGYDKIRVRPGYFPYVEPGLEVDVYHPVKKKWIELGGAGILRPEVVIPLMGKDIPVLAWGQGLERSISEYYKITDIRNLYKNDLKQLRDAKVWLR
tara:strand:- start:632 stop:2128 length:1497 start_codon:yes stop_codon:yes gene_type:complete